MRVWRLAAALLLAASAPAPRASPPASPAPRPCAANSLCLCRADHVACDAVPFYRFPDTGTISYNNSFVIAQAAGLQGGRAATSSGAESEVFVVCRGRRTARGSVARAAGRAVRRGAGRPAPAYAGARRLGPASSRTCRSRVSTFSVLH